MSGLCKVEMSAFMDGRGPHGDGANHFEPTQFGCYRPEMLQALWKVAGEEDTAATGLIRHHSFPSVSIRTRCRNPTLKPLVAFFDDAAGDWRIQNHELFKAGYHPKA